MNKYFKNFLRILFENEWELNSNNELEISKMDLMQIIELDSDKVAFLNKEIEPQDLLKLFSDETYFSKLFQIVKDYNFGYEFALDYYGLSIDDDLLQYFNDDDFFNDFENEFENRILSYENDTLDTILTFNLEDDNGTN